MEPGEGSDGGGPASHSAGDWFSLAQLSALFVRLV